MPTPQEIRKIRLGNDYKQMIRLRGNIISWRAVAGVAPCIEEYLLTINIRTIEGINRDGSPKYRNQSVVKLTIPADYPRVAPQIVMITKPKPFHPNWFSSMKWCYGTWNPSEALGEYVLRMVRTLQFDRDITNENSPADGEATTWYMQNLRSRLFPCDKQVLPDPTGIPWGKQEKSSFKIIRK